MAGNDNSSLGTINLLTGPELARQIDRQPHLAATIRRVIDSPPRCAGCDRVIAALPTLWARVRLPGGTTICGGVCDICAESADLPRAVAAGLSRDGILPDLRTIDAANLSRHAGSP